MLIFFFKINVNLPQLLYFVVLAAINGEYWRLPEITLWAPLCVCNAILVWTAASQVPLLQLHVSASKLVNVTVSQFHFE